MPPETICRPLSCAAMSQNRSLWTAAVLALIALPVTCLAQADGASARVAVRIYDAAGLDEANRAAAIRMASLIVDDTGVIASSGHASSRWKGR